MRVLCFVIINSVFLNLSYVWRSGLKRKATLDAGVIHQLTAPVRKFSRLESAHIHSCKQHIWWAYNKSTFSTVHFGRSPLTWSREEGKSLNDFRFSTSISRFSSDGAVSTAVKGLMYRNLRMEHFRKQKQKHRLKRYVVTPTKELFQAGFHCDRNVNVLLTTQVISGQ